MAYDAAGHLTDVSYSEGTTPDATFEYDADSQKISMTDGTGTTSWTYDVFGGSPPGPSARQQRDLRL
jgi:YD repeat-containing protein